MTNKLLHKAKNILKHDNAIAYDTNDDVVHTNGNNLYIKTVTEPSSLTSMVPPVPTRIITKKNLLEIINDIYKSKKLSNQKNTANHLPKDTLEHHLYYYLKSKYGLTNLIVEWATAIINGIKLYSKTDNEVCLFGKLLRNELEENMINILHHMKTALSDLLLYLLTQKYPRKTHDEVHALMNKIKRNQIYLDQDIWMGIATFLFVNNNNTNNKEDFDYFISQVENCIRDKLDEQNEDELNDMLLKMNSMKGRICKEDKEMLMRAKNEMKILYGDFFQVLLGCQIKFRRGYLRNFVLLFREVDSDLNGVINDEQFKALIEKCGLFDTGEAFDANYERLIEAVDVYGHNQITFSDIVDVLSNEMLYDGKSAMDHISTLMIAEVQEEIQEEENDNEQ